MESVRWCEAGSPERISTFERGRLDRYMTRVGELSVLHVCGSAEDIGRQYGVLVGADVLENRRLFGRLFAEIGLNEEATGRLLDEAWRRLEPYVPEKYVREMRAAAQGAQSVGVDLSPRDFMRLTAATNIGMWRFEARAQELFGAAGGLEGSLAPACTMFAAWGARTQEGKLFAHRNLDWMAQSGIHAHRLIAVYEPEHGIPFVTMGYAGVLGALAGMNKQGISFAEVGTFSASEELEGIPWVFLARQTLEEDGSLEDAVARILGARHTIGLNFLVADGDPAHRAGAAHRGGARHRPRAAAFETNHTRCEVFYADDPKEHEAAWISPEGERIAYGLPLTEAVLRADMDFGASTRALQAADNGPGDPANSGDPRGARTYVECHKPMHDMLRAYAEGEAYTYPLRGTPIIAAGAPRRIGAEEALRIAACVAHNTEKLDRHDWCVMSVVYAPTDLEFWVAYESCDAAPQWRNAPDSGYIHFTFEQLFAE